MIRYDGKVAIVTGGASGIGQAVSEKLGHSGTVVIVADINKQGTQNVASKIIALGGQAEAEHLDVSQAADVQKLVDEIVAKYGHLDYMFNNAGIGLIGDVRDTSLEQWQQMIDVNLWGAIYGTTSAYRVMTKQGFGHIVNTASGQGR